MKNLFLLFSLVVLASCAKEDMEIDPYTVCHHEYYEDGGSIAVLECFYGKSAYDIMMDGDIKFSDRKVAMNHLNIHAETQDPLRTRHYFNVEVDDSLNLVTALNGYKAEIKEEIEFFAEDPQYGYFIDWDVNHSFIGREDGPRSNPIAVTYNHVDDDKTVRLKPRYKIFPPACPNGCDTEVWVDNLAQPNAYEDENGYTHIEFRGPSYFTAKMQVSDVDPEYRINNIPLVQVEWDSDYWMILENLQLAVSYYRPFGMWTQGFSQPLAYLNTVITLADAVGLYGMTNAVGYSIDDNTCLDCPYTENLYGIRTQVNENTLTTQKSVILNQDMVGDTLTIYTKATFAYSGMQLDTHGRQETVIDSLRIVVD